MVKVEQVPGAWEVSPLPHLNTSFSRLASFFSDATAILVSPIDHPRRWQGYHDIHLPLSAPDVARNFPPPPAQTSPCLVFQVLGRSNCSAMGRSLQTLWTLPPDFS